MTQVATRQRQQAQVAQPKYEPTKRYHFQLIQTHEKAKPRDRETGEMMDNPYSSTFIFPNMGTAFNEQSGEDEHCRFIAGYPSIWVKDQTKPAPTLSQISDSRNDLIFKGGSLFVFGRETAKMEFLMQSNYCENNANRTPDSVPLFRLVNEEDKRKALRTAADKAFEAEKAAREADMVDMLPVANAFGIDCDSPEENEDRIRTEFIMKAKQNPEGFLRLLADPKAKYKFNITMALRENIISADVIPGKMVLVETEKVFFDLKEGDVAEQFAARLAQRDNKARELYNILETIMSKTE